MNYYEKELEAINKSNRFRKREIYDTSLIDLASNDYLGLATKKTLFKKAYKKVLSSSYYAPKSSLLVNGYHPIHKKFEDKLCELNNFEAGMVVGSGFLANIALVESLVRKGDVLLIDEDYHASGILATKLAQGKVIVFKHNNMEDLENKLLSIKNAKRILITIEGIYSMSGDIANKQCYDLANKYDALLIVDEAHSSGVIGNNLLGWYDYFDLQIKQNHIKMGTLGKAYGSYGAYILASGHIITYLENRAKSVIYTTAPSIFDIALAHESLKYIIKNKEKLTNKIKRYQLLVNEILDIKADGLIVPIEIGDNKKVIQIQEILKKSSFMVGAIRQPTVSKAIIRLILKLDINENYIKKVCEIIKSKY